MRSVLGDDPMRVSSGMIDWEMDVILGHIRLDRLLVILFPGGDDVAIRYSNLGFVAG